MPWNLWIWWREGHEVGSELGLHGIDRRLGGDSVVRCGGGILCTSQLWLWKCIP